MTELKDGLHFDMPESDYHAQRDSLSVSGAKKLLPPSCPAKFKAALELGEEHKPTFDVGKVAHAVVLGKGADFEVAPYEDWRSKAARDFRDETYEAGKTPILAADFAKVQALAEAIKAHPLAAALFTGGESEVSAAWTDPATGVKCRARFDYLPEKVDGKRLLIPDLKTALSAQPGEFGRSAGRFHYAMQDQWYTDAARALGLDDDPAFLFVVVEKEPPYIVTVGQLREEDKKLGRALNDKARRIFAECLATDTWPAYTQPDEIAEFALPVWHHNDYEEIAYS